VQKLVFFAALVAVVAAAFAATASADYGRGAVYQVEITATSQERRAAVSGCGSNSTVSEPAPIRVPIAATAAVRSTTAVT
jgi:predicted ATP-dependent Lon-type protease